MSETQEPEERPRRSKRRTLPLVVLYAFAMLVSLGVMPAIAWWESLSYDISPYEVLLFVNIMIPFFIAVGYAFVLPLLLFRRPVTRYGLALLLQVPLWVLFFAGSWIAYSDFDPDTWAMVVALVILALFGGFIPIAIAVGLGGWRLGFGKVRPLPVGIQDLLVVIALVAVGLTIFRQSGIIAREELPSRMVILMLGFYALSGMIVFSSLLLAIRLTLGTESRIMQPRNLLGIVLTMLLVIGLWSILWLADEAIFSQNGYPVLEICIFSAVCWSVAVVTAFIIGWSLRLSGFRLGTRATDSLGLSPAD